MEIKDFLERVLWQRGILCDYREDLAMYEEKIISIGAVKFGTDKVQTSYISYLDEDLVRLEEKRDKVRAEISKMEFLEDIAEKLVSIERDIDADRYRILKRRYLDGMSAEEISKELKFDRSWVYRQIGKGCADIADSSGSISLMEAVKERRMENEAKGFM